MVTFLHYRKSQFCKGYRFSNAVKIMIFISDVQNYIPIKLCKTAGSIHLFKVSGMLKAKNVRLNKIYLWDTLEIDGKEVTVTFNDNKKELQSFDYVDHFPDGMHTTAQVQLSPWILQMSSTSGC